MIFYSIALNLLNLVITEAILCNGVIFRKGYYDKHILYEGLGKPNNLMMHTPTGNLFFSHTIQNGSVVNLGILACHIVRNHCKHVSGIPGGYAIAWDRGNNIIFLGGHDGIYKYETFTNRANFFGEKNKSIWGIFVRRNFYYIEYPLQKLYVYKNRTFVPVPEAVNIEIDNIFVTKQFSIYFSNKTGLYKVNKPNQKPVKLKENIQVRQLTYDDYGDIYVSASDGIYMVDKHRRKIRKVANIENMLGMTFHKAGKADQSRKKHFEVIYSDYNNIYLLLPSNNSHICINNIVET